MADRILEAIRRADGGLSRTEIRDLFSRHEPSRRIDLALSSMEALNLIQRTREDTGGRPVKDGQLYSDKRDISDKRGVIHPFLHRDRGVMSLISLIAHYKETHNGISG